MEKPLTAVGNGRDSAGKFGRGNRFGGGNPNNIRAQKLRNALLKALTPKDLREVVMALLTKAKQGDVQAAREVLDRALGKPRQEVDVAGGGLNAAAVASAVLAALDEYPAARLAVAARLKAMASGDDGA